MQLLGSNTNGLFDWSMYVNEDKSNSAAVDLTNNALLNLKPYAERQ